MTVPSDMACKPANAITRDDVGLGLSEILVAVDGGPFREISKVGCCRYEVHAADVSHCMVLGPNGETGACPDGPPIERLSVCPQSSAMTVCPDQADAASALARPGVAIMSVDSPPTLITQDKCCYDIRWKWDGG